MSSDFRNLVFAQKTDRGLLRENNEDSCGFRIPDDHTAAAALGAIFIVADGIGGIGRGEEASRVAIETILATYYDPDLDDDDPRERIIAAIQDANEAVRARARTLNVTMMGTTLAGVVIVAQKVYLFNVGDSRIYLLRGQHITQVTADHSSIDVHESFAKAKLTAFIGQLQPILPHLITQELQKDDTLLICSDGLWGLVEQNEIASIVQQHVPQKAVEKLIQKVYERGARDNVTITIIQNGQRQNHGIKVFALLLVIGVICVVLLSQLNPSAGVSSNALTATAHANASFEADSGVKATPVATETEEPNFGQLTLHTPTK
jgi:PPM family protein phosphatase